MNQPDAAPLLEAFSHRRIDRHVGRRIRQAREGAGFNQEQLGGLIEVSFQQIQKYEAAVNRVGASTLYRIAIVLRKDVSYFFSGLPSPARSE